MDGAMLAMLVSVSSAVKDAATGLLFHPAAFGAGETFHQTFGRVLSITSVAT